MKCSNLTKNIEIIKKLYIEDLIIDLEYLAKVYNTKSDYIRKYFKKLNIPLKSSKELSKYKKYKKMESIKNEIIDLYVNKNVPCYIILEKFDITYKLLIEMLKENNIKVKKSSDFITKKFKNMTFKDFDLFLLQRNIIRVNKEIEQKFIRDFKIKTKCLKCAEQWESRIADLLRDCGCPFCKLKNQTYTYKILLEYFNNIKKNYNITQYKYKDNKNHKILVDFYIEYNVEKIIIEYNGEQHYSPVSFGGHNPEKTQKIFERQKFRDNYLREYCKNNRILLIEIDGREYNNRKKDIKPYLIDILKSHNLIEILQAKV